jgi:YhhN-like protein
MKEKKQKKIKIILGLLYVIAALITIFAEYKKDVELLKMSKSFLIPLLAVIYFLSAKKVNRIYVFALFFSWLANLFFIIQTEEFIFSGAISYLIFWIFITFLVLTNTTFPDKVSFSIAILPFAFVYCCVLQLIYGSIEHSIYLFFLNGIFMTFLGAYSLANYFINSNKSNTYLLICILFFTFIQFLVSIDLYYLSMKLFRPIAMLLFASAQYFLLRTIISYEGKHIIDKAKKDALK